MTIHDELILALIKPNKLGKPTGKIIKIAGTENIRYALEASYGYEDIFEEKITMTPDIVVDIMEKLGSQVRKIGKKKLAIELENDIHWDFADSLRQIKKYNELFEDVVVIIPKEYERFAVLYKNEGFHVWLWKATRVWECMKCGNIGVERRTVKPKCSIKSCNSNEQRLKGLKDSKFEEHS